MLQHQIYTLQEASRIMCMKMISQVLYVSLTCLFSVSLVKTDMFLSKKKDMCIPKQLEIVSFKPLVVTVRDSSSTLDLM